MSEEVQAVPKLVITLEGERAEFRAFSKPNQWALMQNAQATKDGDATASLASTYKLAMTSVIPHERPRFEEFMLEHGQDDDLEENLTNGLFALWNGETMLPLEPTSSDSSDSTGETASISTADSSGPESSPEPLTVINGESVMAPGPSLALINGSSIPV